jgi:hypothetical protein
MAVEARQSGVKEMGMCQGGVDAGLLDYWPGVDPSETNPICFDIIRTHGVSPPQ